MIADLIDAIVAFPHAACAGAVIASVCSLLGVFVILKRVVFIGIVLSQAAATGIAVAMVYHFHPFLGAVLFASATVTVLAYPSEGYRIPRDAVLGVIFVMGSGLSILVVAESGFGLNEVKALLYGGLILTSPKDLAVILGTLLPVAAYLLVFLRPTLYTFLDRDAARVLGIRVVLWDLLFFYALGIAVSAASKVAGTLLVFAYLVVAPATGLLLSRRLWPAIALSMTTGLLATTAGLGWSYSRDLPTNQSVAVATGICFVAAVAVRAVARAIDLLRGARHAHTPPPP